MKLTTLSSNRQETAAFLETKTKDFLLPEFVKPAGYKVVANEATKQKEGVIQTICLIWSAGENAEIVYKVKTIVRDEPNAYLPLKKCTQLIVWRQIAGIHGHVLSCFAREVFNFLLQSYNVIITDEQQTPDGQRFWLDRIGEALVTADREVYYVDLNELDDNLVPVIERISSHEELMDNYCPKGWGADESHRNRAFIISKLNLVDNLEAKPS